MSVKLMGAVIMLLAIGILAYGLAMRARHPPRVVSTGSVVVEDKAKGRKLTLDTRVVEVGGLTTEEVRLPNGTWLDCGGDCAGAVKRQHLEFWDQPERKG